MSSKESPAEFDIVIVGGAMTGATLALALAQQNNHDGGQWQVALIESSDPLQQSHSSFDARAIALSAGSVSRLSRLGLWSFWSDYAEPIKRIHVSDKGHWGVTEFAANDYDVDALGYVVTLAHLAEPIWQRLSSMDNVRLYCPSGVAKVKQDTFQIELTLSNGDKINTRLLVGADGTPSLVRQQLRVGWQSYDYQQVAIVANVKVDKLNGSAYERFTSSGPLALLPMKNDAYSMVWVQSTEEAEQRLLLSDEDFLQQLNRAFGNRVGRIHQVSKRHGYSLLLGSAEKLIHHRAVLVGNAAQTLHPVAGQGFNLGLRDVDQLATELESVLMVGADPGEYQTLDRYQQARQDDRDTICSLTHALVRLFSNDRLPLALGRNLGLLSLQLFPKAKAKLARLAMGVKP